MPEQLKCLRCQGEMQAGFIPNMTRAQMVWHEGEPPKTYRESFMFGRQARMVSTYRCLVCGYLESYAPAVTA